MINEAVRLIDGALRDGTIGIEAKLAGVAREAGDAVPDTPTIYNEMEHIEAATDAYPDGDGHVILVSSGIAERASPRTRPVQDEALEIMLRGCLRNTTTAAAMREVSYVYLATTQTLAALVTGDPSLRLRNDVGLVNLDKISGGITQASLNDRTITWQMRYTATLRAPTG